MKSFRESHYFVCKTNLASKSEYGFHVLAA